MSDSKPRPQGLGGVFINAMPVPLARGCAKCATATTKGCAP